MEFWDALEDSQYLDAVASVRDGPRPICKWEIPTQEQLEEWETRVKNRKTPTSQPLHVQKGIEINKEVATAEEEVLPLTLDWFVSCPIGFYFFSNFVKEQHTKAHDAEDKPENGVKSNINNNQNENDPDSEAKKGENNGDSNGSSHVAAPGKQSPTLANRHAFFRMNFLEELLRLQNLPKTNETQSRQVHHGKMLLKFVQIAEVDDETGEIDAPKMTYIRESDLHLPRRLTRRQLGCMAPKEVEAAFSMNFDCDYQSNLVGLKGPLLQDFVVALKDWIEHVSPNRIHKAKSEPLVDDHSFLSSDSKEDKKEPQTWEELIMSETAQANKSESLSKDDDNSSNNEDEPNDPSDSTRILRRGQTDPNETDHALGRHSMFAGSTAAITSLEPVVQKVQAIVYESLKRDYSETFTANSNQYNRMRNFLWYQDRRVVYDDFYVMRVLGRGGFGLVSACQKGTTGKLYAMKVMSKKRIKLKKSVHFVLNERKALAAVSESPFIINLKYSLHSEDEVYLILDLMSGGDLGFHLHQKRRFEPNQCLYYAARIMLGLQALHDKGYAYRDLKPENCLLSEDGRVKLTDLGLATRLEPKWPTGVVGTRGYWAPEMHKRDESGRRVPYNHVVDWFSFGCCIAEFICGKNPFRSEAAYRFGVDRGEKAKERALDRAIKEMDPELDPVVFAPDAADLCRRLLDKDPTSRLGSHGGCKEIMAHPWFKSVNWESIIKDHKKPPFIPPKDVNAASQHEIGNFADDNSKALREIVFDESDEQAYESWDWINPKAYETEVLEFLIFERELGRPLLPETMNDDLCCCNIL